MAGFLFSRGPGLCLYVRHNEENCFHTLPRLPSLASTQLGHAFLALLREEAARERHQPDDDIPRVPSPLDSPQSRRAASQGESNG